MIPTIDFETYSEAGYRFDPVLGRFMSLLKGKPGLKGVNAATYAMHPSTRVISLAYDLGEGVKLWVPRCSPPDDLFDHIVRGGLIEAHNSIFEYYIWNYTTSWPPLPLAQLRCSSAKARAAGLPGSLGPLSNALNATQGKDKRGAQLIRLLSIPKKPTKKCSDLYRSVEKYPALHTEMYEYNIQDVVAEKSISTMVPELSDFEQKVFLLDQEINTRGVAIDVDSMNACISIFKQAEAKYTLELQHITRGAVKTVDELTKGSAGDKWLISQGVTLESLAKPFIKAALETGDLPDNCRRALEIRQIIGGASIKKLFAIERTLGADGRIRDLFSYCGAGKTGRWAGRGPQPQNLKNSGPDCVECRCCGSISVNPCTSSYCGGATSYPIEWGDKTTKEALKTIATRFLDAVERQWGDAVDVVSSCLRGLFIAAPGHDLICSDYSAIEAVVLAMLAGEQWRIDVFRTHGKIYEASISKTTDVPLQEILDHKKTTGKHHPLRKKGKLQELSLGYGGWIRAMKAFGAGAYMAEDEMKTSILSWRDESPMIPEFWGGQWRKEPDVWRFTPELYGLEGAAISAISNPGVCFSYRDITYGMDPQADILYCLLPSGRKLSYHEPRLTNGNDPRGLEVMEINFMGWNADSTKGPMGWVGIKTWGARMVENVCQAVARDIMAAALLRADAAGYHPVLHVHDEMAAEVPEGFGSVEELEQLMMIKEPWFADWPIKAAGGWRGKRFRK